MNLREIAAAAGVSLTTVSLVLNDKPGVGAEKRQLVRAILLENGYHVGSGDNKESGQNICFIKFTRHSYLVNGNPGFVTNIMDTIEKECRNYGYTLIVKNTNDLSSPDITATIRKGTTRGVILLGTELEDEDYAPLASLRKPLVVVDNGMHYHSVCSVTMHNHTAIRDAVSHLHSLGHREIGFLGSTIPCSNDRDREESFRYALSNYSINYSEDRVYHVFPSVEGARENIRNMLAAGTAFPSALVANNDMIALGAISAFRDAGYRVPEDISVTGVDGLNFSAICDPSLTTLLVSCSDMGYWTVHLLHNRITNPVTRPCKILIEPKLQVRNSTGPCSPP